MNLQEMLFKFRYGRSVAILVNNLIIDWFYHKFNDSYFKKTEVGSQKIEVSDCRGILNKGDPLVYLLPIFYYSTNILTR